MKYTVPTVPAIWLIVLIIGLPQLSETIYTPSLPDIARALLCSESMVEYTLTIYLVGFSVGVFFWGMLSDRIGRKPCVLGGVGLFIIGCVGCYYSDSIAMLMCSRFVQALGGSIGSVVTQAITRDAFQGTALNKVYSTIGSAMCIFPAIGPVIGGQIAEYFGWSTIFLVLMGMALCIGVVSAFRLPETHHPENRQMVSIPNVIKTMFYDKHVLGVGLIVGICNGMYFSYFAEGPFYLIKMLGLSPSQYGFSFVMIALSSMAGGLISSKLNGRYTAYKLMKLSNGIVLIGNIIFVACISLNSVVPMSSSLLIAMTITTQMIAGFGMCSGTSNALAIALVKYKWCTGTASSLFGSFYYCVVSLVTLGMGTLHNGTLWPMPLYFACLSGLLLFIQRMVQGDARISKVDQN